MMSMKEYSDKVEATLWWAIHLKDGGNGELQIYFAQIISLYLQI